MSKLSLREIKQSQLDETPIIDGQLIVCLDTGNAYRDSEIAHVKIGSDLEVVSELPLAPLIDKIYLLKPDKLYVYTNDDWLNLNDGSISLKAVTENDTNIVNLILSNGDTTNSSIGIIGKGGATITTDGDSINIEAVDPNQVLENLTNAQIDEITGGYVSDDGNGSPLLPIIVDTSLTISGCAADAKTVGTLLSEKSDVGHDHDERYYTEEEVDNKIATAIKSAIFNNNGITNNDKQLILTLFESITYNDADMKTTFESLKNSWTIEE